MQLQAARNGKKEALENTKKRLTPLQRLRSCEWHRKGGNCLFLSGPEKARRKGQGKQLSRSGSEKRAPLGIVGHWLDDKTEKGGKDVMDRNRRGNGKRNRDDNYGYHVDERIERDINDSNKTGGDYDG